MAPTRAGVEVAAHTCVVDSYQQQPSCQDKAQGSLMESSRQNSIGNSTADECERQHGPEMRWMLAWVEMAFQCSLNTIEPQFTNQHKMPAAVHTGYKEMKAISTNGYQRQQ